MYSCTCRVGEAHCSFSSAGASSLYADAHDAMIVLGGLPFLTKNGHFVYSFRQSSPRGNFSVCVFVCIDTLLPPLAYSAVPPASRSSLCSESLLWNRLLLYRLFQRPNPFRASRCCLASFSISLASSSLAFRSSAASSSSASWKM